MNTYYIAGFPVTDELRHHGVLGQEWGKRNGPPYPLSDGAHSLREKAKNWKLSVENRLGLKLIKEQKRMIKIGLVAAGALYLNYKTGILTKVTVTPLKEGGFSPSGAALKRFYAAVIHDDFFNAGRGVDKAKVSPETFVKMKKREAFEQYDEKMGLYVKNDKNTSIEADCKAVNPDYSMFNSYTSNNCGLCSVTYDLRRRGYDVLAAHSNTGMSRKDFRDIYPGLKVVSRTGGIEKALGLNTGPLSESKIEKALNSFKGEKNTRGILSIRWANSRSGHACSYEVTSTGELLIVDSQIGKIFKGEAAKRYLSAASNVDSFRTDNKQPDIKLMKEKKLLM